MISYKEAQKLITKAAQGRVLQTEAIPVSEISNRICAEDIIAPLSIQPFDNSAMDGFAVLRSDLTHASPENPITLTKIGVVAAGDPETTTPLTTGTCVQIMTGAPTPPKAEAVVPIELVEANENEITFFALPKQNDNIRFTGEDFKKGDIIYKAGCKLQTTHILPLATLGVATVTVFKKPRAAFLATGLELVDDLSAPLSSGQIYNSNRPYSVAILEKLGVEIVSAQTIHDDLDAFASALASLEKENLDFIISSGAVSAGEFDFVAKQLEKIGAEIIYHKVKIKPGKPTLLAKLPNGTLYFGLPGNPVATAVGLRFFVEPAIRTMMGIMPEKPIHAKTMHKFTKRAGLHMFLKGQFESWEDGSLTVDILDGQASFMVSPFLNMTMWVDIPEDISELKAGDMVDLYPLLP